MNTRKPFAVKIGNEIIVVNFGDEIAELYGYAMDGGDELVWYIMGTDAWLELREIDGQQMLVATNYNKTYFSCIVSDDVLENLKTKPEDGILLLSTDKLDLSPESIKEELKDDSTPQEMNDWLSQKMEEDAKLSALVWCYYTEDVRNEYHKNLR